MKFTLNAIGTIQIKDNRYDIQLFREYIPGLLHVEHFSHLYIIWWAHLTDTPEIRKRIVTKNIFRLAPGEDGVFASRSPERPNPVMISIIKVDTIDLNNGTIITPFIDAEDGTPIIDIKPYFPVERIKNCTTPSCYGHWPKWAEDAENFNWKNEINID